MKGYFSHCFVGSPPLCHVQLGVWLDAHTRKGADHHVKDYVSAGLTHVLHHVSLLSSQSHGDVPTVERDSHSQEVTGFNAGLGWRHRGFTKGEPMVKHSFPLTLARALVRVAGSRVSRLGMDPALPSSLMIVAEQASGVDHCDTSPFSYGRIKSYLKHKAADLKCSAGLGLMMCRFERSIWLQLCRASRC